MFALSLVIEMVKTSTCISHLYPWFVGINLCVLSCILCWWIVHVVHISHFQILTFLNFLSHLITSCSVDGCFFGGVEFWSNCCSI